MAKRKDKYNEKLKQFLQSHKDELSKGDIKGFIKDLYSFSNYDGWEGLYCYGLKLLDSQVGDIFVAVNEAYDGEIPNNFFWGYRFKSTEITIPGYFHKIGRWAFYGCKSLKKVVLSDGVEEIGEQAFDECTQLTSITIPESVTKIDKYALGPYRMEEITIICKEGTAADKFAKEQGRPIQYIN